MLARTAQGRDVLAVAQGGYGHEAVSGDALAQLVGSRRGRIKGGPCGRWWRIAARDKLKSRRPGPGIRAGHPRSRSSARLQLFPPYSVVRLDLSSRPHPLGVATKADRPPECPPPFRMVPAVPLYSRPVVYFLHTLYPPRRLSGTALPRNSTSSSSTPLSPTSPPRPIQDAWLFLHFRRQLGIPLRTHFLL